MTYTKLFFTQCCAILALTCLSVGVFATSRTEFFNSKSGIQVGSAFAVSQNSSVILNASVSNLMSVYRTTPVALFTIISPNNNVTGSRSVIAFSENRTIVNKQSAAFNTFEENDKTGPQFWIQDTFANALSKSFLAFWTRQLTFDSKPLMTLSGLGTLHVFGNNQTEETPLSITPKWLLQINTISAASTIAADNLTTGTSNVVVTGTLIGNNGGDTQTYFCNLSTPNFYYTTAAFDTGTSTLTFRKFNKSKNATTTPSISIVFTSTAKTFVIDHPIDHRKYLVHAVIEGPEVRVYYRGHATLTKGHAKIILPSYFEALTQQQGRVVVLTNTSSDTPIAVKLQSGERILAGILQVMSQKPCDDGFDWEVLAIRKDTPPLVVEPKKADIEVKGMGPYTYVIPTPPKKTIVKMSR